jgi:hypothetical protein
VVALIALGGVKAVAVGVAGVEMVVVVVVSVVGLGVVLLFSLFLLTSPSPAALNGGCLLLELLSILLADGIDPAIASAMGFSILVFPSLVIGLVDETRLSTNGFAGVEVVLCLKTMLAGNSRDGMDESITAESVDAPGSLLAAAASMLLATAESVADIIDGPTFVETGRT